MKTYCKHYCSLCGRITSANGVARASHMRKHVREGYYIEFPTKYMSFKRTEKPFDKKKYQLENKGPKDNPFLYYKN